MQHDRRQRLEGRARLLESGANEWAGSYRLHEQIKTLPRISQPAAHCPESWIPVL